MPVNGVTRTERFFRAAASLDVDRRDVRRLGEFVARKTYDMLVAAEAAATANGRDVIEPRDLPITRGIQQRMDEFEKMDADIDLAPLIDQAQGRPAIDLSLADETDLRLPVVAGGLTLALARMFPIIDPQVRNPATEHWERAFQAFDLLT